RPTYGCLSILARNVPADECPAHRRAAASGPLRVGLVPALQLGALVLVDRAEGPGHALGELLEAAGAAQAVAGFQVVQARVDVALVQQADGVQIVRQALRLATEQGGD